MEFISLVWRAILLIKFFPSLSLSINGKLMGCRTLFAASLNSDIINAIVYLSLCRIGQNVGYVRQLDLRSHLKHHHNQLLRKHVTQL